MTDLLLRGGRVVDPGTGTDSVRDVHVRDDRVVAVGPDLSVDGAQVVDVTGLVVGPGFVDLHSHVHSIAGQRLQAFDGVTTALDLESGLMPLDRAYRQAAEQGRPLHYGFSASWGGARSQVLAGIDQDANLVSSLAVLGDPRWQATSTPAQRAAWLEL